MARKKKSNLEESVSQGISNRWWLSDIGSMGQSIANSFSDIDREQESRRINWAKFISCYENISYGDLLDYSYRTPSLIRQETSYDNVVGGIVDAVVSKIGATKPRPVCVSIDGDLELINRTAQQTRALEGIFDACEYYAFKRRQLKSSCIFDNGYLFWYPDPIRNAVLCEPAWIDDIKVAYSDGRYGKPRNMIRHRIVSRGDAIASAEIRKWNVDVIRRAGCVRDNKSADTAVSIVIDDPISIYEAWHLPSNPEAKNGIHALSCDSGLLTEEPEEWELDTFPCSVLRWSNRELGFYGQSLVEQTIGPQKTYDQLNGKIFEIIGGMTVRGFIEENTEVNFETLTNRGITLCKYRGGPPPAFMPDPGLDMSVLQERDRYRRACYDRGGINELAVTSRKPAGLSSGEALREVKDQVTERFLEVNQSYEESVKQDARLAIWCAGKLPGFYANYKDERGRTLKRIAWSDVIVPESKYIIQIRVSSYLPTEINARMERISELKREWPQAAPFLSKFVQDPDIDAALGFINAPIDIIMKDMELLQTGEEVVPSIVINFDAAKTQAVALISRLISEGLVDETVKNNILNYIMAIDSLKAQVEAAQQLKIQEAMATQQAQQGMVPQPPGPPIAMPPGPVNNIIPMTGQ